MTSNEIWSVIDRRQQDLLDFCAKLIQIPSENPPCDVEEVTKFLCDFLDSYNIPYEVVRPVPDRPNILATFGKREANEWCLTAIATLCLPATGRNGNFRPIPAKLWTDGCWAEELRI